MPRIWSVGHGARSIDELLATLEHAGIRTVVDIRTAPGSRTYPHFGAAPLAGALAARGIRYVHVKELGGWRRPRADSRNVAIRSPGLRGYADHLASDEFARGYTHLKALAREAPTAYLCAETLWWRCHRRILSDRLEADGWEVVHLVRPGETQPHRLTKEARIVDGDLVYDRTSGS